MGPVCVEVVAQIDMETLGVFLGNLPHQQLLLPLDREDSEAWMQTHDSRPDPSCHPSTMQSIQQAETLRLQCIEPEHPLDRRTILIYKL